MGIGAVLVLSSWPTYAKWVLANNRSLFIQARGALKKELLQHLRRKRAMRRTRHKNLKGEGLGQITDTVSISERPAIVEDRAEPGHWEGDLIFGTNGLLRQCFPKGTDLSAHSQAKLNAVARRLNERPRKTLDYFAGENS
jgi:IS30 family transposase